VPQSLPARNDEQPDEESFEVPPAPAVDQSGQQRGGREQHVRNGPGECSPPGLVPRTTSTGDRGARSAPAGRRALTPANAPPDLHRLAGGFLRESAGPAATAPAPSSARTPERAAGGRRRIATLTCQSARCRDPVPAPESSRTDPPLPRSARSGSLVPMRHHPRHPGAARAAGARGAGISSSGAGTVPRGATPLLDPCRAISPQLLSMAKRTSPFRSGRSLIAQQLEQVPVPVGRRRAAPSGALISLRVT